VKFNNKHHIEIEDIKNDEDNKNQDDDDDNSIVNRGAKIIRAIRGKKKSNLALFSDNTSLNKLN
jgi:hypothetical protein